MNKDASVPWDQRLGLDLNRRSFLAESICFALGVKQAGSVLFGQVYEKSANISYSDYRNLLRLCFIRNPELLKRTMLPVLGMEAV